MEMFDNSQNSSKNKAILPLSFEILLTLKCDFNYNFKIIKEIIEFLLKFESAAYCRRCVED